MEPSSTDIRYFLETIEAESISKGARNLGISQPSLSLAINRIEKFIGQPVFIRSRNGIQLTLEGKKLYQKSQFLMNAWADLRDQITSTSSIKGKIIFGCHPEVAIDSLPLFLPKILTDNKDLEFEIKHDISRNITDDVINSKVDLGIVINPLKHQDLIIKELTQDEMSFWSSKKTSELNQISKDPIIICDTQLHQCQKLLKSLQRKTKVRQIINTPDLEVITSLTSSGCGIGILPSEVALREKRYQLKKINGFKGVKDLICLIYRVENKNNTILKYIVREITDSHKKYYKS